MELSRAFASINTLYFAALLAPLAIKFTSLPSRALAPQPASLIGFVLFIAALLDYGLAIWLEKRNLSVERIKIRLDTGQSKSAEAAASTTAFIVAALGVAPSIYCVIGAMIGVPQIPWFWLTWGVTALAFMRQRSRQHFYEQAVAKASEDR